MHQTRKPSPTAPSGNELRRRMEEFQVMHGVDLEAAQDLLQACCPRTLEAGEVLITRGQINHTMFLILSGHLTIHLDSADDLPMASLEAGQIVGELSVIDNSQASAFVVARRITRLLEISEETFWHLARSSDAFAKNLLKLLARRVRATNAYLSAGNSQRRQLEREVMFDSLTNLHNRRWLDENLPRFVQRHRFEKRPVSLMLLDLDGFKAFNDTYGHAAGDRALRTVSRLVTSNLRPTDFAARYGGEELVVIFPNTDLTGARVAAERLRVVISTTPVIVDSQGASCQITASMGLVQVGGEEEPGAALDRADAALYRAKHGGRNRVEWNLAPGQKSGEP